MGSKRRSRHGVWWDCDDGSVKRYSAGADEREEEEIRAVVLHKMQNANRVARDGIRVSESQLAGN